MKQAPYQTQYGSKKTRLSGELNQLGDDWPQNSVGIGQFVGAASS
jgi:hypothetical protein